jgi:hypothetical protein
MIGLILFNGNQTKEPLEKLHHIFRKREEKHSENGEKVLKTPEKYMKIKEFVLGL